MSDQTHLSANGRHVQVGDLNSANDVVFPDLLEEAKKALVRGWVLIPLRGKIPCIPEWPTCDPPTLRELKRYVSQGCNLGMRTGETGGTS